MSKQIMQSQLHRHEYRRADTLLQTYSPADTDRQILTNTQLFAAPTESESGTKMHPTVPGSYGIAEGP